MTFIPKEIQQRIANGIQTVENRLDDGTTPDVRHYGDEPDQWYKLTTGIDPSTHEASANPGKWDASANSGAGAMTADTSVTRTLRDPTELLAGGKGNWVLCRPWGSQNGIVWQLAEGWHRSSASWTVRSPKADRRPFRYGPVYRAAKPTAATT